MSLLADDCHALCPLWVITGHLRCPLYPRKQTSGGVNGMSAKGQKRTQPQQVWLLNMHGCVGCFEELDRRSCLHALFAKCLRIPFTTYDPV